MRLILWVVIFVIISHSTGITDRTVLHSFSYIDRNSISDNNWSNETHFTWFLYPPWEHRNDLFNNKPDKSSVEYFIINHDDHINNESYIETSKLTVCNEVNLSFYSKINNSTNKINFILLIYKHHVWTKEWEYINNHSQWQLHQLKINITNKTEDVKLRFLPILNSSTSISIAITIPNITTYTDCLLNQIDKNISNKRRKSSINAFLFIIFGSLIFLIFITVMSIFIYAIIKKQYNQWARKRSSRRRKKSRRNVVRDESTVLYYQTDTV